jgi:hypothetical protein
MSHCGPSTLLNWEGSLILPIHLKNSLRVNLSLLSSTVNFQPWHARSRFRSHVLRRYMAPAHDSGQMCRFEGKIRSLFGSFTTHLVIGLNVRRNQPQSSNVGLNVRSSTELSRLYCSGSRRDEAMNGNLSCIFSTEKYAVIKKRGRLMEITSKFHPEIFGLNVRRYGPQPSSFVRSFSQITTISEMNPNFHPNVFWVKIRTRGSQASICVRIFTQFTTNRSQTHDRADHGADWLHAGPRDR